MLFNTVINTDTSINVIHNISTRTLCLLLLLPSFVIDNSLSDIATSNASNSIITLSTTIIIETSMNATIPSIIINTGINRCRTAVTTTTITTTTTTTTATIITVVVTITAIK